MTSTITRLVPYVSIFGKEWTLTELEAATKLAKERKLYERWKDIAPLQPPRIANRWGEGER